MNLFYGEVLEIFSEEEILMGKVRIRGATKKIPLGLLTEAAPGDTLLICDGVAIGKVAKPRLEENKKMCLAIPGKLIEISNDANGVRMGKANFGGIVKQVCLEYTPEVETGDYVLVHVGFALSKVDEEEAARTYAALERMQQLGELDTPEIGGTELKERDFERSGDPISSAEEAGATAPSRFAA